jgi:hypothetical protein
MAATPYVPVFPFCALYSGVHGVFRSTVTGAGLSSTVVEALPHFAAKGIQSNLSLKLKLKSVFKKGLL